VESSPDAEPSEANAQKTGRSRLLILLTFVALGCLIIGLSGGLANADRNWWSSTLGNAGVTVLLALPIAFYLERFGRKLNDAADRIEVVAESVSEANRSIRDEVQAALAAERQRVDDLFNTPGASDNYGGQDLVDLMSEAVSSGLVSRSGLRVDINRSPYLIRFVYQSNSVHIYTEELYGRIVFRHICNRGDDISRILARMHTEIEGRGGGAYDPLLPIEKLGRDLRELRRMSSYASPGDVEDVRMLLKDGWYIIDGALMHFDPPYSITDTQLENRRENWERHISEKTWVNIESAERALTIARWMLKE
jgi:hypothetical protein